jgi:succinoglycan biosynthesis protein ExoM
MNETLHPKEHISVCICTFKRPLMLKNLLNRLEKLKTDDEFTYSVVVVDNDVLESAHEIVDDYFERTGIQVRYEIEPERGYAHVRNRAVKNSHGDFIAFIDDDEYPEPEWLYRLYKTCKSLSSDGVLGPVVPQFESVPPQWILRGRVCERPSFETGTVIARHSDTRTGNVLLKASLFHDDPMPFDPRFGKMGGEDVDFFKRKMSIGKIFVWCDEARVREVVPEERMNRVYFLRRALLRGFLESKDMRFLNLSVLKSITAIVLYTTILPIFLLMGQHVFMKYLIKDCDHLGKLFGVCGITLFRERAF